MTVAAILTDAFGRIRDSVHRSAKGLTASQLGFRVDPDANSIGWLLWHLTRVQDDHFAEVAAKEQIWLAGNWAGRFGLAPGNLDTGYGASSLEVEELGVDAGTLTQYHDAVYEQTIAYLSGIVDRDLEQIVDPRWDPPVTLGVRLVSVVTDDLMHAGQAEFVRGVVERS
jgi:uncharacterized damage-inducible protein DinB